MHLMLQLVQLRRGEGVVKHLRNKRTAVSSESQANGCQDCDDTDPSKEIRRKVHTRGWSGGPMSRPPVMCSTSCCKQQTILTTVEGPHVWFANSMHR